MKPSKLQKCLSHTSGIWDTNSSHPVGSCSCACEICKYLITHTPRLFRDNLQHCVRDFTRLLVAQFTIIINEVMSYECPLGDCEFEIVIRGDHCQRFFKSLVVLLSSTTSDYMKVLSVRDWTFSCSSLSEKTTKSNHLQMSEQRQHFLFSYLKTLSHVGPAGNRTQAYRSTVWYSTNCANQTAVLLQCPSHP